jgi:hypothetical protein
MPGAHASLEPQPNALLIDVNRISAPFTQMMYSRAGGTFPREDASTRIRRIPSPPGRWAQQLRSAAPGPGPAGTPGEVVLIERCANRPDSFIRPGAIGV